METAQQQPVKSKATFFVLFGLSTAFLLATPVAIFLFVGIFLDKFFKTAPLITLVAVTLGGIGGIMNVLRLVKAFRKMQ